MVPTGPAGRGIRSRPAARQRRTAASGRARDQHDPLRAAAPAGPGRSRRRASRRRARRPRRTRRARRASTSRRWSTRTQRTGGSPGRPSSKIVVRPHGRRPTLVDRAAGLGHGPPGLGVLADPLQHEAAVVPGEVLGVGQPRVDASPGRRARGARRASRPPPPGRRGCPSGRCELSGIEREAVARRRRAAGSCARRPRRGGRRRATAAPGGVGGGAGAGEHRRVEVHAGDVVARRRERDGEPTRSRRRARGPGRRPAPRARGSRSRSPGSSAGRGRTAGRGPRRRVSVTR